MGRSPCCGEINGLKKGPWTPEEDELLVDYIFKHGFGSWRALPKLAGLRRCCKSCRFRWTNYLRPNIKRGKFSPEEESIILRLHSIIGNRWSAIATHLPGRTDNEIKNFWNTRLRKKLIHTGIDQITHQRDLGEKFASAVAWQSNQMKGLRDLREKYAAGPATTTHFRPPLQNVASWASVNFLGQALPINNTFEKRSGEGSNTSLTSFKTISPCSSTNEEHTETEYSSEGYTSLTSFEAISTHSSPNEEHMETEYSSEGIMSHTSFKAISTGITSDGEHMGIEYVAQSLVSGQSSSKDKSGIQVSRLKRKRPCSDMPHTQPVAAVAHTTQDITKVQDAKMATIKVSYKEDIIKFPLPYSASLADLIENVTTRLNVLTNKPFQIKYQVEDGVWIPITCDKDLKDCMDSSVTQKAIRMSVVPIPKSII